MFNLLQKLCVRLSFFPSAILFEQLNIHSTQELAVDEEKYDTPPPHTTLKAHLWIHGNGLTHVDQNTRAPAMRVEIVEAERND